MNHNPFISFNDGTEITYSDIKRENNYEYIIIFSETPSDRTYSGFNSFEYIYPSEEITNVKGYNQSEVDNIMHYIKKAQEFLFELAKEEEYCLA